MNNDTPSAGLVRPGLEGWIVAVAIATVVGALYYLTAARDIR